MTERALLLVLLVACGSDERTQPSHEPAPPSVETIETQPEPQAEEVVAPEARCELGYERAFTASVEQSRANRAALAAHRREQYDESSAAFAQVVEDAPGYTAARFNLACARARAGEREAARATLVQVLCEDLPTNLPRALADEDLAGLREDIESIGRTLVDRYRVASEGAMPLVAFGENYRGEDQRRWSQPVRYTGTRIIPVGPRLQGGEDEWGWPPMFPSFIAEDRVVQVETRLSGSEGGGLPSFRVVERSLFDGQVRHERAVNLGVDAEYFSAQVGVHDGRVFAHLDRNEWARPRTVWIDEGPSAEIDLATDSRIAFGLRAWSPTRTEVPARLDRRARSLSVDERTIELDDGHARLDFHRVFQHGRVAIVHSSSSGDCGVRDRFFIQAVATESGSTLWTEQGEGHRLLHFMGDALLIQSGERLFLLEEPMQNDRTPLPEGLGVSSAFIDGNPMC